MSRPETVRHRMIKRRVILNRAKKSSPITAEVVENAVQDETGRPLPVLGVVPTCRLCGKPLGDEPVRVSWLNGKQIRNHERC